MFIIAQFSLLQKGSQFETHLYIKFPKTRSAILLSNVLGSPGPVIALTKLPGLYKNYMACPIGFHPFRAAKVSFLKKATVY